MGDNRAWRSGTAQACRSNLVAGRESGMASEAEHRYCAIELAAQFTTNMLRAAHLARIIVRDLGCMSFWPDWVRARLKATSLSDSQRFSMTLWLIGNGASPSRIAALLVGGSYLADASARNSVQVS